MTPINLAGLDYTTQNVVRQLMSRMDEQEQTITALRGQVATLQRDQRKPSPASSPYSPVPPKISVAADFSIGETEINQYWIVTCTSACAMSLPSPQEGLWIGVYNNGSATLSIKNGAVVVCALRSNAAALVRTVTNSSGVPTWPISTPQHAADGTTYTTGTVIIDSSSASVLQKSTDGNLYQLTMDTGGRLVTNAIAIPTFVEAT